MAAAGLAENDRPPVAEPDSPFCKLSITAGVDLPTAYYFRGYLQADNGLIVQPYVNLFVPCTLGNEAVVRPYVAFFNSTHFGEEEGMREMSDGMLGAITTWRGWVLDARYAYYNISPVTRSDVHELGLRASMDLLCPWQDSPTPPRLGLRLFAGVYGEASDQKGTEDAYLETGLEPSWRFELAGRKVGLSVPVVCGLSLDDYYFNSRGANETVGYLSAGVTASVSLPVPVGWGEWFLNASFQYLHLFADNLVEINGGERDEFIGRVGIGLAF